MLNDKYKIILVIFIILLILYIIKKYIIETFDTDTDNTPSISSTMPISTPSITSPNSILTDKSSNIDNIIYYKIILIDNNIRYNLISLSQLSDLYVKKIIHYASIDNNTDIDLLLQNNNIDDIKTLIDAINNDDKYIPNNDIIFAIKEIDTQNIKLNNIGAIISFKDNFDTVYNNTLYKRYVHPAICTNKVNAKIHMINNNLSLTCYDNNINKNMIINNIFIDYKETKINGKYIKLTNITNFKDILMPDIFEITLSPIKSYIKIVKENI